MTYVKLPRLMGKNMAFKGLLHPADQSVYDNLEPLSTANLSLVGEEWANVHDYVEVYTAQGSAGIFRVSSAQKYSDGQSNIDLEHGICVLGDGVIPGEMTMSGSLRQVAGDMLAYQVVKVNGAALWRLGDAPDVSVEFENRGHNILAALLDVVNDLSGYGMEFDQSALPWTLHIRPLPTAYSCEGRMSRNVVSASITYDDSDWCTRVYCEALEGDNKYIDGPTIDPSNPIVKTITAGENVEQGSLRAYIAKHLEDHKHPTVTIVVDALDLSRITGEPLDRLKKGAICRLALPDYGITVDERILAANTPNAYGEPERVRLSLANRARDTAKNFIYLQNQVNGGASYNRASGGRYGGGAGLAEEPLMWSMWKTQETVNEHGYNLQQAGIDIAAQGVRIAANETNIESTFGRIESAEAEILVQAGEIALKASSTDLDGLRTEVGIEISALEDQVTVKASKVYVDAQITEVKTLIAEEIDAAWADFDAAVADAIYTKYISAVEGRFTNLYFRGYEAIRTTIPIVTSFTQALGEAATATEYTLLTVA